MRRHRIAVTVLVLLALAVSGCGPGGGRFRLDPSLRADLTTFGGHEYVPLIRACAAYDISCDWDTYTRKVTLHKGAHTVIAMTGSDRILVDGRARRLPRPLLLARGTVYVPVTRSGRDLFLLFGGVSESVMPAEENPPAATTEPAAVPALSPAAPYPRASWTVVLDPGHGGKDPGAIGRVLGLYEKEYALAIARDVAEILRGRDIAVVMTRDDDTFIPLAGRARIANTADADLFVSIHINSARTRFLRGFECYYLSDATDDCARALEALENSSLQLDSDAMAERSSALDRTLWDLTLTENRIESAHLAERICRSVAGSVPLANRGVKTAAFYVLQHTNMPSVLVEVCYLSNPHNEQLLERPSFRRGVAEAIAGGILAYTGDFERQEGFTRT